MNQSNFFLPYSPAIIITHAPRLALNLILAANRVQCLFSQLAFVCHVQIKKLAAGVSRAPDFRRAFLETGFVASEVVAHQLAAPEAEEVARMLARSTAETPTP